MKKYTERLIKAEEYAPIIKTLPQKRINEILNFIETVKENGNHKMDKNEIAERLWLSLSGEMAVEKIINKEFIDLIPREKVFYNTYSMKNIGFDCIVKTIEYGKYPIIKKNEKKSHIIVLKGNDPKKFRFMILGVATPEILRKYSSIDYIISEKIKAKNIYTAFYGFDHLIDFYDYESLSKILKPEIKKK